MDDPNINPRKVRLSIGIETLQRFGRAGAIAADVLLKEMPPERADFDRDIFMAKLQKRLGDVNAQTKAI